MPLPTPAFSYDHLSQLLSDEEIDFLTSHEVIQGDDTRPVVMLTYDDTINDKKLNHILDVYAEAKVKTSFFFIGIDLQNVATSIPRVVDEGHVIGFHGWKHIPMVSLSNDNVNEEFKLFTEAIDKILPGYRVRYFRAPYGARNDRIRKIGAQWGMQHVLWSLESGGTTPQTYHNVVDRVINGSVVLSHAIRYYDVTDADKIVAGVLKKGYKLETLDTGRAPADQWKG
jgi:peptidoglycan/xylan/chitin deacetylase (PgdA/CDA1 family)